MSIPRGVTIIHRPAHSGDHRFMSCPRRYGLRISADLGSSRTVGGISTFSASAGNGFGLEYGTGVGYSQVIPLGNVYALIPSAPRR